MQQMYWSVNIAFKFIIQSLCTTVYGITILIGPLDNENYLRAFTNSQNWPARPVHLQREFHF